MDEREGDACNLSRSAPVAHPASTRRTVTNKLGLATHPRLLIREEQSEESPSAVASS